MRDEAAEPGNIEKLRAAVERHFVVQTELNSAVSIRDALASLRWTLGDVDIDVDLMISLIRARAAILNRRLVP